MADNLQNERYLGDILTQIAEATGVATAVRGLETLTGKDCGCAKRRQALNDWHQKRIDAKAAQNPQNNVKGIE